MNSIQNKIRSQLNFSNEWSEKYIDFISTREQVEIGENHHYIPKCIKENNDTIKISVLDHFKAHWYLYKAFKEEFENKTLPYSSKIYCSICFALSSFNQTNNGRKKKLSLLSEEELNDYGKLLEEARQANHDAMKGDLNPAKRDDIKMKIKQNRKSTKGISYWTPESIKKMKMTYKERGHDLSDMVHMYHVISGEICRVYKCAASCMHENWQMGMKYIPKDDTLYWCEDYLKLKRSLQIREYMTGLSKTEEHINKINKNPEKIAKTAAKHRGMKRSEETKQKQKQKRKMFFENGGCVHNKGIINAYNPLNPKENDKFINEENIPKNWIRGLWFEYTEYIGETIKDNKKFFIVSKIFKDIIFLQKENKKTKIYNIEKMNKENFQRILNESGFTDITLY